LLVIGASVFERETPPGRLHQFAWASVATLIGARRVGDAGLVGSGGALAAGWWSPAVVAAGESRRWP
jgi:hypothetical protein